MRTPTTLATLIGTLLVAGCASLAPPPASFQSIPLQADLDRPTLERYQAEMKEAKAAGGTCHMATLERSNWWLPGLLVYWHRGSVETMPGKDGRVCYMVSQTRGYGPLSVLYVSKASATFDAEGKRLNDMAMTSLAWGHLAMFHSMQSRLDADTWMTHSTAHLLHHLVSITDEDGMIGVSLFSAPNPLGVRD